MEVFTEMQVEEIVRIVVEQVRSRLLADEGGPAAIAPSHSTGIFDEIEEAVAAASEAQAALLRLGLEKRGEIIQAMRNAAVANAEVFARMAVEETGMGRFQDKVTKNLVAALKTPGIEDIRPEVMSGDHGLTLEERQPFGVIASITPSTNPSETVVNNGIGMIAAGNSVVISPHPGAKGVTLKAVEVLNQAIQEAGGPPNLLVSVREPTIQKTQDLIKHPKISLVVATGGPGVVQAVLCSGKKAIGAGAGNPPAIVDDTADICKAARDIVAGNSFDNGINCIGEKEVLVVETVADQLIEEMQKCGAYLLRNKEEIERLVRLVTTQEGQINKAFVGKDATSILKEIGISAPKDTKSIIFEVQADHVTVMEEFLMPILPIVRVKDINEAIELAVCIEGGRHHTAVIHSKNVDNMTRFALAIKTTIFVKNGPSFNGVGIGGEGYTTMTIAGPTGEGLTSARNFTRVQRCVLVEGFNLRGKAQ
ncbi:Succinate-semialdehyde dehydrogenase (acetylating) [Neomoorella carbonis]